MKQNGKFFVFNKNLFYFLRYSKIQISISTEIGQPLTKNHSFITQYVLRATFFITVFTRSRINIDSSRQLYNDFGGKELFNIE